MPGKQIKYRTLPLAFAGLLFANARLNAEDSLLGQKLDLLYSPSIRAAVLPEVFVSKSTQNTDDPAPITFPDWLDSPSCDPDAPVPESPEDTQNAEDSGGSETQGMNPLLPPTGTGPAGSGSMGGRMMGTSGSGGALAGGGGGGGGFPSFSPQNSNGSPLSGAGGSPVVTGIGGPVSPEPASMVLLGSGMLGVIAVARRKRR